MGEPALLPIGEGSLLAGKYKLEKRLGAGGMGEVYQAQNTLIGRSVAIKVLKAEHAQNAEIVQRFLREATAANLVRHPNVVDVLDICQDDRGTPFIVQELLEGQDLAARVTDMGGRVALDVALRILLPVVDAVAFGHSKGVVHRDLKPENVFLARVDGKIVPKLLDFGISQIKGSPNEKRMTATGIAMGTPVYMSPEQIQGQRVDARTDVWALGIIIHELLAGDLPFPADSQAGLFVQICTAPPVTILEAAPHLPPELDTIVARCLKKPREERYNDAAELGVELRKLWELLYSAKDGGRNSANHPAAQPARLDPDGALGSTVRPVAPVVAQNPASGNHHHAPAIAHTEPFGAAPMVVPDLVPVSKATPSTRNVPDLAVPDLEVRAKAAPAPPPASVAKVPVRAAPPAPTPQTTLGTTFGDGFDDDDGEALSGLKLKGETKRPPAHATRARGERRTGLQSIMPAGDSIDLRALLTGLGLLIAIGVGIAGIRFVFEAASVASRVGALLGDTKIDSGLQVTGGVVLAILGMIVVPKSYRSMRETPAAGIGLSVVISLCFFLALQLIVHAFDAPPT